MYRNIVFPLDLSTSSWKITLPIALNFVHTFGAELHIIKVIPDVGISMLEEYLPKKWISAQKANHIKQLTKFIEQYIPIEISVTKFVARGNAYNEIINYANIVNADLIITHTARSQLQDYMLESNVFKVAKYAKISVLIVKD